MVYVSSLRALAWAVGCCCAFALMLLTVFSTNYFRKPVLWSHVVAAQFATGRSAPGQYFAEAIKHRQEGPPACQWGQRQADEYICAGIWSNYYSGCGLWSWDLTCVSLQAHSFIFSDPENFGRSLDAIMHPCKYLPGPEEAKKLGLNDKELARATGIWLRAFCHIYPDRFPGTVILKINDEKGGVSIWEKESEFDFPYNLFYTIFGFSMNGERPPSFFGS